MYVIGGSATRKEYRMEIIDKIYKLMNARNWTAYMLAEQSGVDPSTIGHMFAKRQVPKIPTLEKICIFL